MGYGEYNRVVDAKTKFGLLKLKLKKYLRNTYELRNQNFLIFIFFRMAKVWLFIPIRRLLSFFYFCFLLRKVPFKRIANSFLYRLYFFRIINRKFKGVHFGSADNKIMDFLNIDGYIFCNCDVVASMDNNLKLASKSVSNIYSSHFFEHTKRKDINSVLQEWFRILDDHGKVYICVPDLEILFSLYLDNLHKYDTIESRAIVDLSCGIVFGGQSNQFDFHYFGYSHPTLKFLFEKVGFKNVSKIDAADFDFFGIEDTGKNAYVDGKNISLILQAGK